MRFLTICHQILSILTIGAKIGSCRDQFSPSPRAFSISRHFRTLRPHAGLVRLFFINCGHFDRGCLEISARSHCKVFAKERKNRGGTNQRNSEDRNASITPGEN